MPSSVSVRAVFMAPALFTSTSEPVVPVVEVGREAPDLPLQDTFC